MSNIKHPNKNFIFENLTLMHPNGLQGGSYFTKLNENGETLYIQGPKCLTKQGIISTGKKSYCDLMFTKDDEEIIEWFENLEKQLCRLIYNKRKVWFDNMNDLEDIENLFSSPLRIYKSGKYYLLRVNVLYNKEFKKTILPCYNEEGKECSLEELNENRYVIPILEIQGIKFSSSSFQIEIMIKQLMIMNPLDDFQDCLISFNKNSSSNNLENKDNEEKQENLMNLLNSNENNDTETNTVAMDVSGEDVSGEDVSGEDVSSEDISGQDVSGEDVSGQDISGEDVSGEDVSGEDVFEQDISGEELLDEDELTLSDDDAEGTIKNKENDDEKESKDEDEDDEEYEDDEEDEDDEENDEEDEDEDDEYKSKYMENILNNSEYLEEINLNVENIDNNTFTLKNPKDVYYEIWKKSRAKAKKMKRQALEAYLESKKIKNNYMIENIDNSDDELDTFIDKYVK